MMAHRLASLVALLLAALHTAVLVAPTRAEEHAGDAVRFDEELFIRRAQPAPAATQTASDGTVKAAATVIGHWQFTTRWQPGETPARHFGIFPKALGQVLEALRVDEMRLTFSQGEWDAASWGTPLEPGPAGLELWAIMNDSEVDSAYGAESAWQRLTRSLAGLSCSSLESLDEQAVSQPLRTFGITEQESLTNRTVRYGQLNSEASCTENLTPWLKLLPCRSQAGLARLIAPAAVFKGAFHSFSVHYRRICTQNSSGRPCPVELVLSLTSVTGPVADGTGALRALVGDTAKDIAATACSVATSSRVIIETTAAAARGKDAMPLGANCADSGQVRVLTLGDGQDSVDDVAIGHAVVTVPIPTVRVRRHVTGSGTTEGGVVTGLTVAGSAPGPVRVRVLETVPAFLRVIPTSLVVTVNDTVLDPVSLWRENRMELSIFNGQPSVFELELMLAPGSFATVKYKFRQAFLPLFDFPPDPNRGFDIPSTVVSFRSISQCLPRRWASPLLGRHLGSEVNGRLVRQYGPSLVIAMPLPDFSMPYNVITLTSTVLAYLFGGIVTSLIRPLEIVAKELTEAEKRSKRRKGFVKNMFLVGVLGAAWLFENQRDTFDEWAQALLYDPLARLEQHLG